MRELTEAEQAREIGRINGPWPMGDVLPMKNLYESKFGWLCKNAGAPSPTVFVGSIHDFAGHSVPAGPIPVLNFPSIEALVKAGWVGD